MKIQRVSLMILICTLSEVLDTCEDLYSLTESVSAKEHDVANADASGNFSVIENLLSVLHLTQFKPPQSITRHPPPATGRDDNIHVLREILDNLLLKLGYSDSEYSRKYRILFGADNKIGKNLLQLMKLDIKYNIFLPEFPLLHLRKSKITNLFSGYKDAGLVHILKYMKDDDEKAWSKLLTIENINAATRCVFRLSMALHLAFFICFLRQLTELEREAILSTIDSIHECDMNNF